ncbi:hypothetical protein BKA70DRAFT_1226448 [Coprinopsis sp. MPI-PUGE-AT-0042]|nr:hypothetical protein BKA70DRAFT_1226448 [Coprinopsis sp. MPI-PUGE-AT-0042]
MSMMMINDLNSFGGTPSMVFGSTDQSLSTSSSTQASEACPSRLLNTKLKTLEVRRVYTAPRLVAAVATQLSSGQVDEQQPRLSIQDGFLHIALGPVLGRAFGCGLIAVSRASAEEGREVGRVQPFLEDGDILHYGADYADGLTTDLGNGWEWLAYATWNIDGRGQVGGGGFLSRHPRRRRYRYYVATPFSVFASLLPPFSLDRWNGWRESRASRVVCEYPGQVFVQGKATTRQLS